MILIRRRELDSIKSTIQHGVKTDQIIARRVKKLTAVNNSQIMNMQIASLVVIGCEGAYVVGIIIAKLVEIKNNGSASRNIAIRPEGDLERNWLEGLVDTVLV